MDYDIIKVDEEWEWYLGELFYKLISNIYNRKILSVVEFAPGYRYKIANALSKLGFDGDLYIIDSDKSALEFIEYKYKQLLPKAKVIPVNQNLSDSLKYLPKTNDLFLSNHCLDDMLINAFIDTYKLIDSTPVSKDLINSCWENLGNNSPIAETIEYNVLQSLHTFFKAVNFNLIIMSQYKSNEYLSENDNAYRITDELFTKLKQEIKTDNSYVNKLLSCCVKEDDERFKDKYLLQNVQNAKHWIAGKFN